MIKVNSTLAMLTSSPLRARRIVPSFWISSFGAIFLAIAPVAAQTVVLYDQDFENPNGFIDTSGIDVSQQSVNSLYGNQPPGFSFAQQFTVETLNVTGDNAFGNGYSDPSGIGGDYAIGLLSSVQNDLLGLSFNVGNNDFLNVRLDISSIDLSGLGGPFIPLGGQVPVFEFTLFDNPSGAIGTSGNNTVLSSMQASGNVSDRDVFDWTEVLLALDSSGATNGNVTLRVDLLSGGYAAFDNLRIAASNDPGDLGETSIPEPSTVLGLLTIGGIALGASKKKQS